MSSSFFLIFTLFFVFSLTRAFPIKTLKAESEVYVITEPCVFDLQATCVIAETKQFLQEILIIFIVSGLLGLPAFVFYCVWKIIKKHKKEEDVEKQENSNVLWESPTEKQTVILMPATEINTEIVKAEEAQPHVNLICEEPEQKSIELKNEIVKAEEAQPHVNVICEEPEQKSIEPKNEKLIENFKKEKRKYFPFRRKKEKRVNEKKNKKVKKRAKW
ncbi:uncharacterized protein LOC121395179 isoform X1 [Xenopus laevis]|uniref:Uncharacterized protein LOC121395179 isoform X1 n=1 Tax=Xenopus laevis TaxID=8355 RepID=A0A8J1L5S2_XENLA|nr:uncharacterized protein LOC121395179 isoform X1 [Xenopus laevis]